jgi:hypothetical protein
MCGWMMTVGEMLAPVVWTMRRELLAGSYIQADETTVDVQMHERRGKNHQGYLWQYGTPGGATIFDFQMGRGREGPAHFLDKFEGILQTDGYVSYVRGVGGPKMVHAACWTNCLPSTLGLATKRWTTQRVKPCASRKLRPCSTKSRLRSLR